MPDVDPTLAPPSARLLRLPELPASMGYGEEHDLLRWSARRWLDEKSNLSSVRRLVDDPVGFDPALVLEMAGLGWLSVGDLEGEIGPVHLAVLAEEMGRVLMPSPYLGSALVLAALSASASPAQRAGLEPSLSDGTKLGSLALEESRGGLDGGTLSTRAERDGDFVVLSGEKIHVGWGAHANLVIVSAREAGGGIALYAVPLPSPGVSVDAEAGVDSTRRTSRVSFHLARLPASCRLDGDARSALPQVTAIGALALAAEMTGAADAVLEMTRAYACQRVQFGRAIGSFQAVKHPLVDLMIGVELARSLVYGTAALFAEGNLDDALIAARMAKAHASEVFAGAVQRGVQLHGGFGFTWEADLHFFFKRMLATRASFGDAAHHKRKLAASLFGQLPDEP